MLFYGKRRRAVDAVRKSFLPSPFPPFLRRREEKAEKTFFPCLPEVISIFSVHAGMFFCRRTRVFSKSAFKRAACPKAQSCRKFLPAPSSSVACYVLIPLFLLLFISFFPHLHRDSVCALSLEGEEGWFLFSLTLSDEKTKVRENPLRSPAQVQGFDKYFEKNHDFSTLIEFCSKYEGKFALSFVLASLNFTLGPEDRD